MVLTELRARMEPQVPTERTERRESTESTVFLLTRGPSPTGSLETSPPGLLPLLAQPEPMAQPGRTGPTAHLELMEPMALLPTKSL
jgi:hypothetical protein